MISKLLSIPTWFARRAYVPNTGTAGSAPVIDRRHLDPIPLKHNVGRQSDSKKPPQIDDKDVVVRVVGSIVYVGTSRPAELAAVPCPGGDLSVKCCVGHCKGLWMGIHDGYEYCDRSATYSATASATDTALNFPTDSTTTSTVDTTTDTATFPATASASASAIFLSRPRHTRTC
ncbi:hypothetical protein BGY98DRAFT_939463 [Russula aff. rugulosa BPL654]|nr:hypothetical protein BGY98DRAFT_939463 [Russula aff. rugulosa BPL654]